jgi:hypothetical protein
MHALIALFAAAAVQAAPAHADQVKCKWEPAQSNGIPVKVCMTDKERKLRTSYMQQQIRENQQRSYVKN